MSENLHSGGHEALQPLLVPIKRRSFFMYAGATAGATALVLSGCKKDDTNNSPGATDVGSGNAGILNYAYALEQLEAAFYAQIKTGTYYSGLNNSGAEKQILDDLAGHEAIHRDFLKAAINRDAPGKILKDLKPNFSSINFNDRASVLGAAKSFEDLGVAAYNGAGRFFDTTAAGNAYLSLAGKIVSVEARHAALIRDLLTYNSFVASDVVDIFTQTSGQPLGTGSGSGKEKSKRPQEVLATANTFLADDSKLSATSFS